MTYSYYIRTNKSDKADLASMTEEQQKQIGQMIFRIMLESAGRYQESQKDQNHQEEQKN